MQLCPHKPISESVIVCVYVWVCVCVCMKQIYRCIRTVNPTLGQLQTFTTTPWIIEITEEWKTSPKVKNTLK